MYLDNAATTQKPRSVIKSIVDYYERSNANVHRGIHRLAEEATAMYEGARKEIARFVNAGSDKEIIFTRGTTESINLVAQSYVKRHLRKGDEILLTEMEHHSNLIPWQMLAAEKGLKLRFLPFDAAGLVDVSRLEELWSERIRFVSVVHMSNVFGSITDIKSIIELSRDRGVPVLLDAAQSVPHMPVDIAELGCDFLAFSGHKMYGPTGIGALYARGEILETMDPFLGGGDMIQAVWLDRATWNEPPHKFEAGTPNIAGAVGFGAAASYLESIGMDRVAQTEGELTRYALEELEKIEGMTIYGPKSASATPQQKGSVGRGGVISFNVDGVHSHDMAQFLDQAGIAVRAGHHCAQPVMRKLGVPATVRASLSFYNTREEIDVLCTAIDKAKEFFGHGL